MVRLTITVTTIAFVLFRSNKVPQIAGSKYEEYRVEILSENDVILHNMSVKERGDNNRKLDSQWLRENMGSISQKHLHQWVAVENNEIIASGKDIKHVADEAYQKGATSPLFEWIEAKDETPLIL